MSASFTVIALVLPSVTNVLQSCYSVVLQSSVSNCAAHCFNTLFLHSGITHCYSCCRYYGSKQSYLCNMVFHVLHSVIGFTGVTQCKVVVIPCCYKFLLYIGITLATEIALTTNYNKQNERFKVRF